MNPFGVHFKLMTASKWVHSVRCADTRLVLVGPDGYVSPHGAQLPINEAGFAIHSAVHRSRPEVNAAAHCHTQYGKAWSVFGKPVDVNNQDACYFFNNQGVYLNGGRVVSRHATRGFADPRHLLLRKDKRSRTLLDRRPNVASYRTMGC